MTSNLIILSSGGTGGHMSPAQALGHDLLARGFDVEIMTDERGLRYQDMFTGMPVHVVKSGTLGSGILAKLKGPLNLVAGFFQAWKLLKAKKPAVVVGFGGYPSVPGVFAAQLQKIPTIIHEQNAIIGKANAFLAPRTERIALPFERVQGLDNSDQVRSIVTGNPVRSSITALYTEPYPALDDKGLLRIFVMGGSQGASIFNDIVPAALTGLPLEYKSRIHIVQQCREEDLARVKKIYKDARITAKLKSFFTDVDAQLLKAHLVIGRSGASTVAEVTTAGRPAIFVPYPHHKDQQQMMNADSVADAGGAWVMTENGFTSEALLARIETFLQNPETLFRAAENARACGKPDAARKLGNLVVALARGWDEEPKQHTHINEEAA